MVVMLARRRQSILLGWAKAKQQRPPAAFGVVKVSDPPAGAIIKAMGYLEYAPPPPLSAFHSWGCGTCRIVPYQEAR